ncbi:hypothetical protein BDW66DRAFT_40670 [Aspergillus desertorum]
MKPTIALLSLSALPLSTAWTFTWRDSSGKVSTEKGTGPSDCIVVDHAKGQLFVLDGQGEQNINMLLFENDECEGEPAGMATESFAKEASVDLKGFQVVEFSSGSGSGGNATTTTTTANEEDGTVTLPTVSATSTSTSTDDGSEGEEGDEDGTVTLPTVSATTTTTNGTSTAEPTTTTTTPTTTTETGSDSESSSAEPTSSESAGGEEEPTPTGASSRLVPLSLAGLVAGCLGVVAGGF